MDVSPKVLLVRQANVLKLVTDNVPIQEPRTASLGRLTDNFDLTRESHDIELLFRYIRSAT